MNEGRIMRITVTLCLMGLAFSAGLFAANKHLFADVFEMETVISEDDVPADVRADALKRFPAAKEIEWKIVEDQLEATFYIGGKLFELTYSEDGEWLSTEWPILFEKLPEAAREFLIEEAGSAFRIGEVEEIEMADGSKRYEVVLTGRIYEYDYVLDAEGKLIEKERDK